MSKSDVEDEDFLLCLLSSLFRDLEQAFTFLSKSFAKDKATLLATIRNRGVGTLFRDLPLLSKHLDRCLDSGQYVSSRLPLSREVSKTTRVPRLFSGLYLLIFDRNGSLLKEPNIEAILFLRQAYCLVKKVRVECSSEIVDAQVCAFLQVDSSLPRPSSVWDEPTADKAVDAARGSTAWSAFLSNADSLGTEIERQSLGSAIDYVFSQICEAIGPYHPAASRFSHGPGAVAGGSRFSQKYHWSSWPERLESFFPIADYGFYSYSSWAANFHSVPDGEEASRLIAVPKSFDKMRLIAAEPASHQWCQQNVKHHFYESCAGSWISSFVHFYDQSLNQALCRKGSVDGSLITLDLSEASDRVSCLAVQVMFRRNPEIIRALAACRTRFLDLGLGDHVVALRKYATMGNATTFPVETLLFLGLTLACVLHTRKLKHTVKEIESLAGEVAVFGDDIVAPVDSGELVIKVLEAFCFKINENKSFLGNHFRESCGVDVFRGCEVTTSSIRSIGYKNPGEMVGLVEASNHFYSKWFLNVSSFLRRYIGERISYVHPTSGVFGYHCRVRPDAEHPCSFRWNRSLQQLEVRVILPKAVVARTTTEDDSCILQYFTERPTPESKWSSGYTQSVALHLRRQWVRATDLYPWLL